jgi:hypothetical protein
MGGASLPTLQASLRDGRDWWREWCSARGDVPAVQGRDPLQRAPAWLGVLVQLRQGIEGGSSHPGEGPRTRGEDAGTSGQPRLSSRSAGACGNTGPDSRPSGRIPPRRPHPLSFSLDDFGEEVPPHCTVCDARFPNLHSGNKHYDHLGHVWDPGSNPRNYMCEVCRADQTGCWWIIYCFTTLASYPNASGVLDELERRGVRVAASDAGQDR